MVSLRAATSPPRKAFRELHSDELSVFVPVAMPLPESLHLELRRRGRINAYWNGLAWVV
jgi:hypothetical protein